MRVLLLVALSTLPLAAQRYQATAADQGILLADSDAMRVTIRPKNGAEVSSVQVRFAGAWREIIWSGGSSDAWKGHAPWLWPATSRNFPKDVAPNEDAAGSSYNYKGKRYPMPAHGFARDMEWKVESMNAGTAGARAVLSLVDTPKTREMYPFGWKVEVEYNVSDGELTMEMRVRASEQNGDEMFFSAGNHITFRTPLVEGSDPLKMTLQSPSTIEYVKKGFMPTGEKIQRSLEKPVPLNALPVKQAVTLGHYPKGIWMTLTDPAGLAVLLEHTPSSIPAEACLFNMWGDAAGGYFSPEPWVGMQNSFVSGDGLVKLKPGADWRWRLKLSYLDLTRNRGRQLPAR
ncbi:MAG: hypothetical protein ABI972_17135 [Acidobacteriota bacterium]